jgi:hypothetical protein
MTIWSEPRLRSASNVRRRMIRSRVVVGSYQVCSRFEPLGLSFTTNFLAPDALAGIEQGDRRYAVQFAPSQPVPAQPPSTE